MKDIYTPVHSSGRTEPFLYLWIDTATWVEEHKCHKRYLGIHNGRHGYSYIGSGKQFKTAYSERPDDFKRIILRHDESYDFIHSEETVILKFVSARANTAWYNTGENILNTSGTKWSESHRLKFIKSHKNRSDEEKLRTKEKKSKALKGRIFTDEVKAKISAANKKRFENPENREKLIIANRNRSPEAKAIISEKISASKKGKKRSDEARAAMSAAAKGRKLSDETRAKMSASRKGKPGYIPSAETRIKMSEAARNRKRKSIEVTNNE